MHADRRQTVHTQSVSLSVHAALCCRTSCGVCVTTLCVSHWLQGVQGLGIMIIEGKHAEVGQGIFISDIQEGSAAEQVSYVSHGFFITRLVRFLSRSRPFRKLNLSY